MRMLAPLVAERNGTEPLRPVTLILTAAISERLVLVNVFSPLIARTADVSAPTGWTTIWGVLPDTVPAGSMARSDTPR